MSEWVPLHGHSHFSLLDGLSKPEQLAARFAECGYLAGAVTDHGTIAGSPSFARALKKKGIKAIAGCEFYLSREDAAVKTKENRKLSHLCVLAKNQAGWKGLVRAVSCSNRPENFYYRPRLSLEKLAPFSEGNWIAFSGHPGSDLANVLFEDPGAAYSCRSYDEVRLMARKDWREKVVGEVRKYQKLFGKENFYLEIQLIDQANMPASLVVARALRDVGKKLGVPRVATADSHYPRREDAADQRILLCSALNVTLGEVNRRLEADEDVGLACFFRSNNYHVPGLEEMKALHEPEELACSLEIAARCETPNTSSPPLLPRFECPGGADPDDHLRTLCARGWEKKVARKVDRSKWPVYEARLKEELEVLSTAGLSSYFLIVDDYVNHARDVLKCKVGEGRGSAAGCLVSHLMNITDVDPVRYDLLFSRFYAAARNTPGRVSLPDIDSDFPVDSREAIIDYVRGKYGSDKVCQMATFSRMQGRGALKDVLRAHGRCGYEEMNRITLCVPDESSISDDLQEMLEAGEEPSIIRWALENHPDELREWCSLGEDGELDGPLSVDFAQAIRLEGTKRSMGKHASGVIICSVPLADVVPMVYDKSTGQPMVAFDMKDAEEAGLVKQDILGTAVLDKLGSAESLIRTGAFA